jgi:hypothetical protein
MNVIFLHVLFQPFSGLACSNIKGIRSTATTHNCTCIDTGDVKKQLPIYSYMLDLKMACIKQAKTWSAFNPAHSQDNNTVLSIEYLLFFRHFTIVC